MFCNKCGKELKEGALFCDKCGKKVKSNNGTTKSNKLPFIIISIIVVIAVIIGFIIINKDNTSKEMNTNIPSGINASKELIREDSTAPRGVTYNFKLEDVKRAMDSACKENNTNNYLDFEYSRSQNNVDFYTSYKDETKNYGCLMEVMVYNDYVIGVSFSFYDDMIEELNQNGYNVFFNILRDNYNADYSNKIKSILDNLGNEKHEYFDNTICYKEIQDNFGTTEYSITASTLDSYNELEGASSSFTENEITKESQYYDFIDKENGTFYFDENEIVRRIMIVTGKSNDNYILQGYERTKATIPNQYNYSKIAGNNIETLSITSNPSNGKVSKIKINILGSYTEEYAKKAIETLIINIVGGITNYTLKDSNDYEKTEQIEKIATELVDNSSIKKGLKLDCSWKYVGNNSIGICVEISAVASSIKNQQDENNEQDLYNNNANTTNNSNKSNSSSSNSQKETVEVPYFTMGYELQEYTSKLDNLGISYKIVKGQDLNYSNNTVISVEHNGEKIEKGTTITITVADNVYDMNIMVNTGYLLGLADLGYDYESVNLIIKINDTTICNGTFERTDTRTEMPITVGTYKGKPDNLKLDITIEGKKITKSINYRFVEDYPGIVIYGGGSIGPQG